MRSGALRSGRRRRWLGSDAYHPSRHRRDREPCRRADDRIPATASASVVDSETAELDGGCCTNPRRAHWSLSKGGVEKAASRRSPVARSARPRRRQRRQRPSQRARPRFSQTALCNSHRPGRSRRTRLPARSLGYRRQRSRAPAFTCRAMASGRPRRRPAESSTAETVIGISFHRMAASDASTQSPAGRSGSPRNRLASDPTRTEVATAT